MSVQSRSEKSWRSQKFRQLLLLLLDFTTHTGYSLTLARVVLERDWKKTRQAAQTTKRMSVKRITRQTRM